MGGAGGMSGRMRWLTDDIKLTEQFEAPLNEVAGDVQVEQLKLPFLFS